MSPQVRDPPAYRRAEVADMGSFEVRVEGRPMELFLGTPGDAVRLARLRVYAVEAIADRAVKDLRAGRAARWSYGFCSVEMEPVRRAPA